MRMPDRRFGLCFRCAGRVCRLGGTRWVLFGAVGVVAGPVLVLDMGVGARRGGARGALCDVGLGARGARLGCWAASRALAPGCAVGEPQLDASAGLAHERGQVPQRPAEPFGRRAFEGPGEAVCLEPVHERCADGAKRCPCAVGVPGCEGHARRPGVLETGDGVVDVGVLSHELVEPRWAGCGVGEESPAGGSCRCRRGCAARPGAAVRVG